MKWLWAAIAALIFNFQFPIPNQFPNDKISNEQTEIVLPTATVEPKRFVLLNVPFTSQAPFGEWSDPRHQDGCEEAAALMAVMAMSEDSKFKTQDSIITRVSHFRGR